MKAMVWDKMRALRFVGDFFLSRSEQRSIADEFISGLSLTCSQNFSVSNLKSSHGSFSS